MKKSKKYRIANKPRFFSFIVALIIFSLCIVHVTVFSGETIEVPVEVCATQIEEPVPLYKTMFTENDVDLIAKTVYGEALVTQSETEMAAVVWCILNRVDSSSFPDTVEKVVKQKSQFHGYRSNNHLDDRVAELVKDVLNRYVDEKNGNVDSGRILPKNYLYFYGDGRHNHFTTTYQGRPRWDWSLDSPYAS